LKISKIEIFKKLKFQENLEITNLKIKNLFLKNSENCKNFENSKRPKSMVCLWAFQAITGTCPCPCPAHCPVNGQPSPWSAIGQPRPLPAHGQVSPLPAQGEPS
jgi:hypothetical protein